jgi:hypothetical protein
VPCIFFWKTLSGTGRRVLCSHDSAAEQASNLPSKEPWNQGRKHPWNLVDNAAKQCFAK